MLFENFHAYRVIPTDGRPHLPADIKTFEGDSRGHWEGDTLVVDVTNQNDKTWFDMAGNFHSDALHVMERYTPVDANTIDYQATIEDPKTFSRPWTIAFPITRITRPGYEIMELACVEGERDLKHYTEGEGGATRSRSEAARHAQHRWSAFRFSRSSPYRAAQLVQVDVLHRSALRGFLQRRAHGNDIARRAASDGWIKTRCTSGIL